MDDPFFWPILEAAEALDRPIYLHPRMPSAGLAGPFRDMYVITWAFGVEASLHAVRMIFGGVFDRFPKLKIILGHMREAIPFWPARLDELGKERARMEQPNDLLPSGYLKRNFWITTSGQMNPLALRYSLDVLGPDRVMWAIDYPYVTMTQAVDFLDQAPISDSVKALVYGGTAQKLFHLA